MKDILRVKCNRSSRNSSIELLRIIAAYLIILRHFVGANGFSVWQMPLSVNKVIAEGMLFPLGKVGVVLFFLISAWFLCEGSTDIKVCLCRVWILEREILFYGLVLTIIMLVARPDLLSMRLMVNGVLPLSTDLWWYATSYAVFLVLFPFLTVGLKALGRGLHRVCCMLCLLMWTILGGLVNFISFDMTAQNVMIFIYLYILVSYWRWYNADLISPRLAWIFIGSGFLISVSSVVCLTLFTQHLNRGFRQQTMMGQNEWMLPVIMIGVGLFALFKDHDFYNRFINNVAKSMFAVYLIAVYPPMAQILWVEWFDIRHVGGSIWFVPYGLSIALLVLVSCALVDYVRRGIFKYTIDRQPGKWFSVIYDKFAITLSTD